MGWSLYVVVIKCDSDDLAEVIEQWRLQAALGYLSKFDNMQLWLK